jgi:DNA-binding CsgD family transcriptional regulator
VRTAAEAPEEGGPRDENVVMVVPRSRLEQVEEGNDDLSHRELEVLLLVARGLSNRQVAQALHLSEATVKRHLANIYPKIGVSSRGEATRKALSEGWISALDLTRAPDVDERQTRRTIHPDAASGWMVRRVCRSWVGNGGRDAPVLKTLGYVRRTRTGSTGPRAGTKLVAPSTAPPLSEAKRVMRYHGGATTVEGGG